MSKITDMMGSFTAIPNSVYDLAPELGGAAILVYMHLSRRRNSDNKCWPGYDEIQEYTGLGRKTVSSALEKLVEYGLIKKSRRFGNSTIYELVYSSSVGNFSDEETEEIPVTVVPQETTVVSYETPVVPQETPVVPTGHANKTNLTRNNEQELIKQDNNYEVEIPPHLLLSDAFTKASGLTNFSSNDPEWYEPLEDMVKAGATEADIVAAVKYCQGEKYTIVGPKSIIKSVRIQMAKRIGGNGAQGDKQKPYDKTSILGL